VHDNSDRPQLFGSDLFPRILHDTRETPVIFSPRLFRVLIFPLPRVKSAVLWNIFPEAGLLFSIGKHRFVFTLPENTRSALF
jgi:hypothetical protein